MFGYAVHATPQPTKSYYVGSDLADLLSSEDARLLSGYAANIPDFLLSTRIYSRDKRREAYLKFVSFLKFLRSHFADQLTTPTIKSLAFDRLNSLTSCGFSGPWFDALKLRFDKDDSQMV